MADVDVGVLVPQGHYNFVDSNETIGTEGCGPCVGIIAKLLNNRIFCGHLDSNEQLQPLAARAAYKQKLRRFLRSILNPTVIQEFYYVTDKASWNSRLAAEVIESMFFLSRPVYHPNFDGLYYDGTVHPLGFNDHLKGDPAYMQNAFHC